MMQVLQSYQNRLKFCQQCSRCCKTFYKSIQDVPTLDFGKFFRYLHSSQFTSMCLPCQLPVSRNNLPALRKKVILIDESMAGILSSHNVHGTRQVFCRQAFRSSSSMVKSPYDLHMKDYLTDLIASRQVFHTNGYFPASNGEYATDLKRFLSEVGTDPREARYWLKQFKNLDSNQPFAVIQVGEDVFTDTHQLEKLVSCLSFLQRNQMKPIVIHGNALSSERVINKEQLRNSRAKLLGECMLLTSMLEAYGTQARPLFSGCTLIQAVQQTSDSFSGYASMINSDPIKWCLQTQHVPIIPAVGETESGQILLLDLWSVTEAVSVLLQPLKVMKINISGGYTDEDNNVIANINLPKDLERLNDKAWCNPHRQYQIKRIACLLEKMPGQSSVVVTAVDNMLQELFTHHGSGTFFKITEPVLKFQSLADIDQKRLGQLIIRSFGRELKDDYMMKIEKTIHTLYLSESYNAAALITTEGFCVPYLNKFAVSMKAQGEGTGEMVWECVRKDFPQLFWRSRGENSINPWYFKKSEGSWSNGVWTVFWYGVPEHRLSSELIEYALGLESSFLP